MALEPALDRGRLVSGIVIEDQVEVQMGRGLVVDRLEEGEELLGAMAGQAFADDLAGCHVEGGEQGGGAVALVVMGHGAGAAFLEGQAGLGAVERLVWLFSSTASTSASAGGS